MVIWTYLMIGLRVLAGDNANAASSLSDLLIWPLPPFELMWFLWALFLVQVAVAPLANAPRWALAVAGAAFFALSSVHMGAFTPLLRPALLATAPFLLGLAARGVTPRPSWIAALIALAVFLAAEAIGMSGVLSGAHSGRGWGALLSLVASGAVAALIATEPTPRPDGSGPIGRFFEHLGRRSMAIFLSHVIFTALARTVLIHIGVYDPWVHLTIGTVAGIIAPLALYRCATALWPPARIAFGD